MVERAEGFGSEQQPETRPLDSYLTEPVQDAVSPPAVADPPLLPFDQRSPEDFERICALVAKEIDGLRDVRLYGVRGQNQNGIDLVGLNPQGEAVVYQAKRYATFTDRDLRAAIEKFAHERPFSAGRFVICVASSARRTEVVDELVKQQQAHAFEIALYDQDELSELLRLRADLVRRLFGAPWERVFCVGQPAEPPSRDPSTVLSDALLLGPLDALGLGPIAAEAERVLDADPLQAAECYQKISAVLEGTEFSGFSDVYRLREADCLRRAELLDRATGLISDVAWRGVHRGETFRTRDAIEKLRGIAGQEGAPASAAPSAAALQGVQRWYADPHYDMADLVEAVRTMAESGASAYGEAALWVAESALASERYDIVGQLTNVLEQVASSREAISGADSMAARIRACLADATGDWESMKARARDGRLGSRQAALVHARAGRHDAWNASPDGSESSYRLCIGQSCNAGIQAEAEAALRAIWTIGVRYGLPNKDWQGAPDLARDLHGLGGSYFPEAYDRGASGSRKWADGKLPGAHESLLANLREAVIAGRFVTELDAHSLLAKVYLQAGELRLAAKHQIRAGEAGEVEKWCARLEEYVDCASELARPAPWEQATALVALAAEADLIPDETLERLVPEAINRFATGQRQGMSGPYVWLSAQKLLAAASSRIPAEYVDPILDILEPLIPRAQGHYRHNDEQHVRIVAGLFVAHPELRERTGRHLLGLLASSPDLGNQVLKYGFDALEAGRESLSAELTRLADEGSDAAMGAMLHLGIEHPQLIEEGREVAARALTPRERKPGAYSYGTLWGRAASYARILPVEERVRVADAAMRSAEDAEDVALNRAEALHAVAVLADALPSEVKAALFQRVMEIAMNPSYCSIDQEEARIHPLSTFQVNMTVDLVSDAVFTAATLAEGKDQTDRVVECAWPLLVGDDRQCAVDAARALARLDDEQVEIDLRWLAASSLEIARQLAAVLWARQPDNHKGLGRSLASDSSRSVRQALAGSLSSLNETRPELASEIGAILTGDASAAVRSLASRALTKAGESDPSPDTDRGRADGDASVD